MASPPLKAKKSGSPSKKDPVPQKVVSLGLNFRSGRKDVPEIWLPPSPEVESVKDVDYRSISSSPNTKRARCKNLYEYNKRHSDKCVIDKDLWKSPSIGNNFLPFKTRTKTTNDKNLRRELTTLYRNSQTHPPNHVVRENTWALPPITSPVRTKQSFRQSLDQLQKSRPQTKQSPRPKFLRDKYPLPEVFTRTFTCLSCHKNFTRYACSPALSLTVHLNGERCSSDIQRRPLSDVLSEHYCCACNEYRTRTPYGPVDNVKHF